MFLQDDSSVRFGVHWRVGLEYKTEKKKKKKHWADMNSVGINLVDDTEPKKDSTKISTTGRRDLSKRKEKVVRYLH